MRLERGRERSARRDVRLEALTGCRPHCRPMHHLRRMHAVASVGPRVRLAVTDDQRLGPFTQRGRHQGPFAWLERTTVAWPMLAIHEIQLRLDHRVERLEQLRKTTWPLLEQRKRRFQRLDRRQTMSRRFAPNAIATLRGRRKPVTRQRLQERIELE